MLYLIILLLAGMSMLHYSRIQNRGNVADGAYESIKEISRDVGRDDLIMAEDIGGEVKMALVYYENKNVVSFHGDELDFLSGETLSRYNDIFILSWHPKHQNYLIDENEITYRFGLFKHSYKIPEKFYYIIKNLYLYKLDKNRWINALMKSKKAIYIKAPSVKKDGFFNDMVWTKDSATISGFDFNISDYNYLKLSVYGYNTVYNYNPEKMGLEVFLNDKKLKYIAQKNSSLYFETDHRDSADKISIHTKTFIPKLNQLGEDDRELGIDIKSISFTKEIPN